MRTLNAVALALVIIGGINWGLVGLFSFDLVAAIFGAGSVLARIIYILVGISALYCITLFGPVMSHGTDRTTTGTSRI